MILKSTAFKEGQVIPKKHTGEGEDLSPALEWSGAPAGTKQFALICDDPDAPVSEPWVHWVIYGIPAKATKLPEGVPQTDKLADLAGAAQGLNTWPRTGYNGPMPPQGHGWHRYYFKLYALAVELGIKPGATKKDLLAAMKGHILAEAQLMGKYRRD